MVQIFSEGLELSPREFLLILFGFQGLGLSELVELVSELVVSFCEFLEFLLAHVEVVHDFADVVPSEYFLDEDCLLGEVGQMLLVTVRLAPLFEQLSGVVRSEMGLYFDGGCPFAQILLAFDVHFEFGLYFEGGGVVPGPLLLALVGTQVVHFLQAGQQTSVFGNQFHY